MPVFDVRRNIDHASGGQFNRVFAPFLIVSSSADAYQHLAAAAFGAVDMPVVAAARLKCHVVYRDLLRGYRREIALTDKETPVRVRFANREEDGVLKFIFLR